MSETPPKEITEKSAKKAARKAAGASRRKRSGHDRNGTRDDANDDVREAAKNASEAVHDAPQPAFDLAATAAHVGFGAALGAAFGIAYAQLPAAWRTPAATLGESLAFATGVWAVSYAGWIPALELMPPPSRDEPGRQPTMVAAHWLFGAILGAGLVAGANG